VGGVQRLSIIVFFSLLVSPSARSAVLPLQRELQDVRTSKIFKPLLYRKKLSCSVLDSIHNHALVAYPNPFFLQRIRGLLKLHRCGREFSRANELRQALRKSPKHLTIVRKGTWVCPWFEGGNSPEELWKWIDVSSEFHPSDKYPSCLPGEWKWLWSALRFYHTREYKQFERDLHAKRQIWDQALDETGLRSWIWNRVILSAKRRGDRYKVLRYYRKWYRTIIAGLPKNYRGLRDAEHTSVEMWLMRWEAMLGSPSRNDKKLAWWKWHCQKQRDRFDFQCQEFLSVWLSRYWYEGHDRGLYWIPNHRNNEHVLWWRAMRLISKQNWNKAIKRLKKLKKVTRSAHFRKKSNFWLAYVNSMRRPATRTKNWNRFIEIYGGDDFYSLVAHFFAEKKFLRETSGVPTVNVSAQMESTTCKPTLHSQWSVLKGRRGEFIVEDDVRWYAERLSQVEGKECQENKDAFKLSLIKYCTPSPLWHHGQVPFMADFKLASRRSKLPMHLLIGLSRQESAFCPNAVSWADAIGLMQLQWSSRISALPFLKKPENLFDPKKNLRAGAWEIQRLSQQFRLNWFKVFAAYNAGENLVKIWQKNRPHSSTLQFIELIPFQETRRYVKKVFENWYRYEAMDQKANLTFARDSLRLLAHR